MYARQRSSAFVMVLLFSAPASVQWFYHYQHADTGAWVKIPHVFKEESEALKFARNHGCPRMNTRAVKIQGPGKETVYQCAALTGSSAPLPVNGPKVTSPALAPPPTSSPKPGFITSGMPDLKALRRNPVDAIRRIAEGLPSAPVDVKPAVTHAIAPSALDIVGIHLGMSPSASDKAVRAHMPVGWVYVRNRPRAATAAITYEWMKGYVAGDLSEVIVLYFEPSLTQGVLVGVRRFSMLGKKVDPVILEAALVQRYGRPSHARGSTWSWGNPAGCSASGTGSLHVQDLKFMEGSARSDRQFKTVIASALDLADYAPPNREYFKGCGPVLQVLRTGNNGVMATLVDQKYTMDHLAVTRYDGTAIEF